MQPHDVVVCAGTRVICRHGKINLPAARSVAVSPKATPTRTPQHTKDQDPDHRTHNSWERGIAKEDRGNGFEMPFLGSDLQPVGVKEFGEKRNTGAWDQPGRQVSSAR